MRRVTVQWILCVGVLMPVGACKLRSPGVSADLNSIVSAAGATVLKLDAGSGYLRVRGEQGTDKITILGVGHAATEETLADVAVTTTRIGDTISVVCNIPAQRGASRQPPSLDIDLEIPRSVSLIVTDTAGESVFRHTGPIRIVHGAGSLNVDDVAGNLDVTDGAGDMIISNVSGSVHIVDGAGGIFLSHVGGSVLIPRAGDGEIQLVDIAGDVTVGAKRSGEVAARGVGGNFSITTSGNGSIEYRNVHGRVALPVAASH
ncbi:MAG: hypothetical protein ABI035_02675 [Gemmatimonadaceae bacterium]